MFRRARLILLAAVFAGSLNLLSLPIIFGLGKLAEKRLAAFSAQSGKRTRTSTGEGVWRAACKAEERGELRSGAGAIIRAAQAEGWSATSEPPAALPDLPGADGRLRPQRQTRPLSHAHQRVVAGVDRNAHRVCNWTLRNSV